MSSAPGNPCFEPGCHMPEDTEEFLSEVESAILHGANARAMRRATSLSPSPPVTKQDIIDSLKAAVEEFA